MSARITTGTAERITGVDRTSFFYWMKKGWIKGERNSNARRSWWTFDSAEIKKVANERRVDAAIQRATK